MISCVSQGILFPASTLFMAFVLQHHVEYASGLASQQQPNVVRISPDNNQQFDALPFSTLHQDNKFKWSRRSIFAASLLTTLTTIAVPLQQPQPANAAIDVSGLRQVDAGKENSIILNQIRPYDGSEGTRIQEIQKMKAATTAATPPSSYNGRIAGIDDDIVEPDGVATYAYRYSTSFGPSITKVGNYGEKVRCDDQLLASSRNGNRNGYISTSFEFPSDWLQLDKMLGGIQYVDQRNGDKLYVLKVNLPSDSGLVSVPKQFFGDSIFNPQGAIVRSGITVDEYKVKSSTIISDGSVAVPHRRLLIKYATVTPNGLRTERRAIVDAYEIDSVAYMMVTSSNAVKFDANGRERETVEAIADSFRIEKIA
jgi:hypothetical protein